MNELKEYLIERIKAFEPNVNINWKECSIEMLLTRLKLLKQYIPIKEIIE